LTLIVLSRASAWQMRDPHVSQNWQANTPPLAVGRLHVRTRPWLMTNACFGTMTEIPNADADCLRHSRQWHTYTCNGSALTS
jgi:hypothetical protein